MIIAKHCIENFSGVLKIAPHLEQGCDVEIDIGKFGQQQHFEDIGKTVGHADDGIPTVAVP